MKWQERVLYSPRGHSGYIFTLIGLRDALAALLNLRIIVLSVEHWSHTREGILLTNNLPPGDKMIQEAKFIWLQRNLTPVDRDDDLDVAMGHLSEHAIKEGQPSRSPTPSLTSGSSRSSSSSPSPSPPPPQIIPVDSVHFVSKHDNWGWPTNLNSRRPMEYASVGLYDETTSAIVSSRISLQRQPKPNRRIRGSFWSYPVSFFSFSFHSNQNNVHWRYDSGTDSSSEYTDSEDEREVAAILTDPTPSDSYSVHDYPMTMTHHEHILQCSQHRDRVLHLPGWLRTLINLVPL